MSSQQPETIETEAELSALLADQSHLSDLLPDGKVRLEQIVLKLATTIRRTWERLALMETWAETLRQDFNRISEARWNEVKAIVEPEIAVLRADLQHCHEDDSLKTQEINILTKENRWLAKRLGVLETLAVAVRKERTMRGDFNTIVRMTSRFAENPRDPKATEYYTACGLAEKETDAALTVAFEEEKSGDRHG